MKRMIALLLCVMMVCSMIVPAQAAAPTTVKVTASAEEAYRGDEITLTVSVEGENVWSSMGYLPLVDSEYFTVISGEVLGAGMLTDWSNTDGGVIMQNSAAATQGNIFRFTIKIKDTAPFSAFTVTDAEFISMRNGANAIETALQEASITVRCRHEYTPWEDQGDYHEKVCTICGDVQTDDHSMSDWQQGTAEGHEKVCASCGKTIVEGHSYRQGVCSVCGYVTKYIAFSVTADKTEVYRGDELTFTVALKGDDAWTSIGYVPFLDSDVFEVVSGKVLATGAAMSEWTNTDGGVLYYNSAAVRTGNVFSYTVRIKDTAPFGEFGATDLYSAVNGAKNPVIELEEIAVVVLCRHNLDEGKSLGQEEHIGTCTICGELVTEAHTYVKGECSKCYEMEDYTVIFCDEDGTILGSDTYHYGDQPNVPADPTKAADKTYTYAFAGWGKEVTAVEGDAVYTATYTATYIEYSVTFQDYNGTVISQKNYHYGDKVDVPADPTRAADNTYTYAFAGWDKAITTVEAAATYTATYTETFIEYTVIFKNWDGTVISQEEYHYGDVVDVPADPEKAGNKTYYYVFAGWDVAVGNCAGNATYTAQFEEKFVEYTVTFQYEDGTVIDQKTYHYGDAVEVPADVAVPEALAKNHEFDGWDKEITAVEDNATYTAKFKQLFKRGDVNADEQVTDADAMYLLRHTLFGSGRYPLNQPGDMNGDGQVTDADAMYLLRHTLFGDSRYPLA